MSIFITFIQHYNGGSSQNNRQEKEVKGIQIGIGKKIVYGIITYGENTHKYI